MGLLTFLSIILLFLLIILVLFREEINSTKDKDPAAKNFLEIILLYPGLHAIIAYRSA